MTTLVTGGKGFVGSAVVRALVAAGHHVRVASRSAGSEAGRKEREPSVEHRAMDLCDADSVARAVAGCDTVFHTAALTGVWGPREAFERTNVLGTQHVVAAALAHGVGRLVHTSSASVCFDGRDHERAGNDLPYARRFLCAYPETKAVAERLVLDANGSRGAAGVRLATCALRPHLVVGPGDPHLFPRLLERARRGRLAVVGDGANEVSVTDVVNSAQAHVQAAAALAPDAPHAGRAYFIAQSEPVRLWAWLAEVFRALGVRPPARRVSKRTAYAVGAACEALWGALRLRGDPPMTRFVALQLSTSHSYDLAPARRDFGYTELVALPETTARIVADLRARGAGG